MQAVDSITKQLSRSKKVTILTDALIISLMTIMPPDRVGVIRRLSIGETLKQLPHSENYYIDLGRFTHKTARFYGPSKTPISPMITPLLQSLLRETQSGFEFAIFDEDEEKNRARRRYLFAMPRDATRCLESSNWTARVKLAFKRYHPENKSPCPSLLRSSFITELKASTVDPKVLAAAAIAQKHSVQMQSSSTYDLEAQVRATQAAMAWCEEFACSGDTRLALQGAHVEHAIEAAEAELSMDNPDSDLAAGDGAMKKQRLE